MVKSVAQVGAVVVNVEISIDGNTLPDATQVESLRVIRRINKLPEAEITFSDGDMAEETFPLSDADTVTPGRRIEIKLGYGATARTVFTGIISRQSLRMRDGKSVLNVGCVHPAAALDIARNSQVYLDMGIDEIMTTVITSAGLTPKVQKVSGKRAQCLRAQSTDWQFLNALAAANGLLVFTDDDQIRIEAPSFNAPEWEATYGVSLIGVDLDMDATTQIADVHATSWNSATQTVQQAQSSEPKVTKQGNLTGRRLAEVLGSPKINMLSAGPRSDGARQSLADAELLWSRMARITGTVEIPGLAQLHPGQFLELNGLGRRFSGEAFVGGIRHDVSEGTWTTTVEIGLAPDQRDQPQHSGPLDGVSGLQIGKILAIADDPKGGARIRVALPLSGSENGIWVRPASPYAGDGTGMTFLPEIDDEVVIGFIGADPSAPIMLGALHSQARPLPSEANLSNDRKSIHTRSGLEITFDDDKAVIELTTPAGHRVTLNDDDKKLSLLDSNANRVEMSPSGITLSSIGDLTLAATGNVSIAADGGIDVHSPRDIAIRAANVSATADMALTCTGSAQAEISSSGETVVAGAMVLIN